METEEWEVVWSGKMPLLPPRESRPQVPQPQMREKRLYNKKVVVRDEGDDQENPRSNVGV